MRTKLVLAAAALGAAGVVLPASSASAFCMELPTGHCVNPCYAVAGAWNSAAERANDVLDETLLGVRVNEMYCLA